jgi:hypothetical protein
MVRTGRPRSARAASARIVRIKLRLYPGEDDDLIAFFGAIPDRLRAASVKAALRNGAQPGTSCNDGEDDGLADALDDLVL